MVLIVDFDGTFLKNDFFKEAFFKKLIENPFFLAKHFFFHRKSVLDLKMHLLKDLCISYDINFLVNSPVLKWIEENKGNYEKVIMVSASPGFFIKQLMTPLHIFDEIHGSEDINLKGLKKLKFINDRWGDDFSYIGDSAADKCIFTASKKGFRVSKKGMINETN